MDHWERRLRDIIRRDGPSGGWYGGVVGHADLAACLAALDAARQQIEWLKENDAGAVQQLRNLTRAISYCDDCGQVATVDELPEGPHTLCHNCAVRHKQQVETIERLMDEIGKCGRRAARAEDELSHVRALLTDAEYDCSRRQIELNEMTALARELANALYKAVSVYGLQQTAEGRELLARPDVRALREGA